jgi:hypothetical protein
MDLPAYAVGSLMEAVSGSDEEGDDDVEMEDPQDFELLETDDNMSDVEEEFAGFDPAVVDDSEAEEETEEESEEEAEEPAEESEEESEK